ncbi:BspA family leucine-rich repeat surface protein [Flavobacterium arcticum]|uniref:BspA family leucine-rich repeat surface protein n=1 Tax=Flavobacterium arcticum TaxID=1784713 RepID=A0A345HDQ2_9FLAO|nr:BspA family leucine-rich repeat surface protein [Flavobacterium arcticum]AXG74712.1 BspA family leucine-rich repeat surface protein [Flavobacterium arcticum]KAF2509789.1 BspA family leucine-rich repeat surface protein [Flavobacterium arcticum]
MKKNYLLLIFCFITYFTNAQAPFITTWQVSGSDLTIQLQIFEVDELPDNFTIDFGDGTVLTNQSGTVTHTFNNEGIYTVSMSGEFSCIMLGYNGDYNHELLTVDQWGDTQWTSMQGTFYNCVNLNITATDTPDLTQVENMSSMFLGASSLNQSLNDWDVASVVNMNSMFYGASSFNQPLDNWNVSNVIDMSHMFAGATSFNQSLNDWNVSNLIYTTYMFQGATSFNGFLNNWDVSSVTHMPYMFQGASSFNKPLDNWDVSNVLDMRHMFFKASSFNQSLNSWDVSNVTNLRQMFLEASSFNQPLNNWDVSNVIDMGSMFYKASSFNQPLNSWDVSNVVNMEGTFTDANEFDQDISNWTFNNNVNFAVSSANGHFIDGSSLSINNYDTLLNRFKELGLENKNIGAEGLQYCDEETRDYLINELGWVIEGDSLAEDCTATTELFSTDQLSIYPNPVNNILHIDTKSGVQLEAVTIYNLQGSQLIQQSQDFENINTESLSSGIYILSIQTNIGSAEYKLIKN